MEDIKLDSLKYDEGYGVTGNLSHYIVLNNILTEEQSKLFRKVLEKENTEKYKEYTRYEKRLKGVT